MSRSGYDEDYGSDDPWSLIMYRGAVASSIRGKRGQAFFRDLVAALDAMPEKRLIANDLTHQGEVCAIGSVGVLRGVDMSNLDPEDAHAVGRAFNIAEPLAREIVWRNDECGSWKETPEHRWTRVRAWAVCNLKQDAGPTAAPSQEGSSHG